MSSTESGRVSECPGLEQGPFTFAQISRRLARLPGRLEVDEDEAYRILFHFIGLWGRGFFADDEVVALYGDPPRFRPLKSLPQQAQQLVFIDWRDGAVSLTAPALRRYLERSTLIGAPRLLSELFGKHAAEPDIPRPAMPSKDDGVPPVGKEGGTGKPNISKIKLTNYLHNIKNQGRSVPAADNLFAKIKKELPQYHVTRDDVRIVHREVFGNLRPGKRSKADAT